MFCDHQALTMRAPYKGDRWFLTRQTLGFWVEERVDESI